MEEDDKGGGEQIYDEIGDSDEENLKSANSESRTTGANGKRRPFAARAWTTESTGDKRKLLLKLRRKFSRKSSEEFTNNSGSHRKSGSLPPCAGTGIVEGGIADRRRALEDMHHKTRSLCAPDKASAILGLRDEVDSRRSRSKTLTFGFLDRFRDSKNGDDNNDYSERAGDSCCDQLRNSCVFGDHPEQNSALPPPVPDRPPPVKQPLRQRAQSVAFPLDHNSFAGKEITFQKKNIATEQNSGELSPLTDNLEKLSHYSWYWGPINRHEAEKKLEGKSDGSFLVRDSFHEFHLYSVTFRSRGRTLHTRIMYDKGRFGFMGPDGLQSDTNSVVGLMKRTMKISERGTLTFTNGGFISPSYPIRFLFPLSRYEELPSLQHLCRFVIRQNSRYDKLDELPLPPKLVRYLEVDNHYLPEAELELGKNVS